MYERELKFATQIAHKAGTILRDNFNRPQASFKEDYSPVTTSDLSINAMVIQTVREHFPAHAVLGEESSYTVSTPTHTWVCDPLDGTLPYILGVPTSVFSLALVDGNGRPVVAVVHDPWLKRGYTAVLGKGAFLNGERIHVNNISRLSEALIGNSGRSSKHVDATGLKSQLYRQCYRPIILHSVIYEAMLVASGALAATVMTGDGPYDAASAKLIVEEAGGVITDLFGDEQRYDRPIRGAVISNGAIHSSLVELARSYRAS